jgi:cytoskeletal protein RodZ
MMKKIIKLFIAVTVLCAIIGIGNAFTSELPTFEENEEVNKSVEKTKNDEKVEEKSDLSKEQEKEPTNSSSETEKSKERSSSNKTNSTETPKVEDKTSVKENTNYHPQSENTKTEQNNIPQNTNTEPTPTDTVKENTPWDSLGITEYDYYNKPAQSWANLQFKISDYGSREATEKACHEYGDNNIPEGRVGYWCLSVNSYSGDYLGEEIDFF